jgi:hypothetical protein
VERPGFGRALRADDPRDEDATPELAFYLIGRVGTCTGPGKFG